jgi:type IV pilus assembly protein PilC
MSVYSYKALNSEGQVVRGKLPAANEAELESKLKQSDLDLISSDLVRETSFSLLGGSVTLEELILVCIHLHHLEEAGVPLLDSIADLRDAAENPKLRQIMMDLYDSLKNGKTFSQALESHPKVFDKIFIGLIKAGERTGNFADVFAHLEHHFKWVGDLRAKIKKATYYPTFLLFLMIGVVTLMMVFVIPKLTAFLLSQNIELPVYTTALIATSKFLGEHWLSIAISPVIFYFIVKMIKLSSLRGAYLVDVVKINLPVVGIVIRKIEIARFCHFFAITYKSGIGILECLDSSADVVQNLVIKNAIKQMRKDVTDGRRLTEALMMSGEFPQLVIRMFKVGEDSGNLDNALVNINTFYDAEINTAVSNMVGFMQPALTLVMGGLMMWITLSVFGPIYGSFGSVGKN